MKCGEKPFVPETGHVVVSSIRDAKVVRSEGGVPLKMYVDGDYMRAVATKLWGGMLAL